MPIRTWRASPVRRGVSTTHHVEKGGNATPTAHPPCTVPTALPRYCARMVSPISTEPPPTRRRIPNIAYPRQKSSCRRNPLRRKPLKKVNKAPDKMVTCRTGCVRVQSGEPADRRASRREKTSRRRGAQQPASLLLMCQAAIRLGMTKLYTMTSMPSRAQPPKVAIRGRSLL